MDPQTVVFLLGPTAAGKTASSLQISAQLNAEIISVDSALVYQHMNIGTAKPSQAELQQVPHHLIDLCTPVEVYSVARFVEDATAAIKTVQDKGKVALLTGGTMMYFNALEHGIAPMPDADEQVRETLATQALKVGWPAMHAKLAKVDPVAAAKIHPNDPQRIQRALEVYELTGEPLSELQKQTQSNLQAKPVKLALMPESRSWLHQRIEQRFGQMVDSGLIEEVTQLQQQFKLDLNLPSMRSVGYRQVLGFLNGEYDKQTMYDKAIAATRQLAKRQMTWIRGMQNLNVIACDKLDTESQVGAMLEALHND